MLFAGVAIDEDVIQVHYAELVEQPREGLVYVGLEGRRGVS
jgi:hypothetical protein